MNPNAESGEVVCIETVSWESDFRKQGGIQTNKMRKGMKLIRECDNGRNGLLRLIHPEAPAELGRISS